MRYVYLQGMGADGGMPNPARQENIFYTAVAVGMVPRELEGPDEGIAEWLWARHNRDGRPRGTEIRSMSMGDILVIEDRPYIAIDLGWKRIVDEDLVAELVSAAGRMAFCVVEADELSKEIEREDVSHETPGEEGGSE